MIRKRIWRATKRFIIPFIVTLVGIFSMVWTISRLGKPEYAALVIALMGIAFTAWWDAYKEIVNRRRNRLALLSQLSTELKQNKNVINSILETENQHSGSSNPAPLRIHAWLAATASPYFAWIDSKMIADLISIYGRLDTANYYADVFKTIAYAPQEITWNAEQSSRNARELYLTIIGIVSAQIDEVLSKLSAEIEELK